MMCVKIITDTDEATEGECTSTARENHKLKRKELSEIVF